MGLVTMSERDLQRIEVLSEVLARRRTEVSAAAAIAFPTRPHSKLESALDGADTSIRTGIQPLRAGTQHFPVRFTDGKGRIIS